MHVFCMFFACLLFVGNFICISKIECSELHLEHAEYRVFVIVWKDEYT